MAFLYTISAKKSGQPVVTWNKAFFAKIKQARPESVALMLAKLFRDLSNLNMPNARIKYEQLQVLETETFKLDSKGMWTSKYSKVGFVHFRMLNCFTDGLMQMPSATPDEILCVAEAFYTLMDTVLVASDPI